MLGGVSAGLANYFHIDPTIIRLVFLLLSLFTAGGFVLVYLLMWVLIPTAGSTAGDPNQVIQENISEIGAKVRGVAGGASTPSNGGTATNGGTTTNGGTPSAGQSQLPQYAGSASQTRPNNAATWLIIIGAFFLLANLGFFHAIHWGMWWPVLLVGLGVMMLVRRNHP
jgi:phage shock protein PspC (stress-responsive transcriptional regulator)